MGFSSFIPSNMKYVAMTLLIMMAMGAAAQHADKIKVAVWDTYVPRKDGRVMHFDIVAPVEVTDTTTIYNYGKQFLESKGQAGQPLTAKQCRFCHVRQVYPEWLADIRKQGYFIIEMENCD